MNGVNVGATVSDQDSHLGDTEGGGTGTIASRGVQNPVSKGESIGRGGPATWREREREGGKRITFVCSKDFTKISLKKC